MRMLRTLIVERLALAAQRIIKLCSASSCGFPFALERSLRFLDAELFGAQAFGLAREFCGAFAELRALELERDVLLAELRRARLGLRSFGFDALRQRFRAGQAFGNCRKRFALARELLLLGLDALARLRQAVGSGGGFGFGGGAWRVSSSCWVWMLWRICVRRSVAAVDSDSAAARACCAEALRISASTARVRVPSFPPRTAASSAPAASRCSVMRCSSARACASWCVAATTSFSASTCCASVTASHSSARAISVS